MSLLGRQMPSRCGQQMQFCFTDSGNSEFGFGSPEALPELSIVLFQNLFISAHFHLERTLLQLAKPPSSQL